MWTDVTDLCSRAAEQLTFSHPMITIDEFNLFDAMSAVELMDPKMDQCYGMTCSLKIEDLLKVDFPSAFDGASAAKLLKTMLINETSYLDGASFLESTHQCILLWEGAWANIADRSTLVHKTLLAYMKSLDRSLSHVSRGVLAADIFEEEDFQTSNKTILSETLTDEVALEFLNSVIGELEQATASGDGSTDPSLSTLLQILLTRRALQSFYRSFANWTFYSVSAGTRAVKSGDTSAVDAGCIEKFRLDTFEAVEVLSKTLEALGALFGIPEGKTASKTKGGSDEELAPGDISHHSAHEDVSFAYSTALVKVMQTTAVRTIKPKSLFQSIGQLRQICAEVLKVCSLAESFAKSETLDYEILLHSTVDVSDQKMHVVPRSLYCGVLYAYSPDMGALVERAMRARGIPETLLLGEEVDQWIRFSLARVAGETLRALTLNRSKLLPKLDGVLQRWGQVMLEANYLDNQFRAANEITDDRAQYCSYWAILSTALLMDLQMGLTVESNLLGDDELAYFYWYWDYLCSTRAYAIEKLRELRFYLDQYNYEEELKKLASAGAKGKKAAKGLMAPQPPATSSEELLIRCRGQVCRGLFRQLVIAGDVGLLRNAGSRYTSPAWKFEQRFRSFAVIRNPPLLTYEDYTRTFTSSKGDGNAEGSIDPAIVSKNAATCFVSGRNLVDEIKKRAAVQSQEQSKDDKKNSKETNNRTVTAMEVADKFSLAAYASFMKVVVACSVNQMRTTQTLSNNQQEGSSSSRVKLKGSHKLVLDFSYSSHFPVIEFKPTEDALKG